MQTWTQVPAGDIKGAEQRFWAAIGGNADAVANRINTDPAFVAILARFAITGGYESSISHTRAHEIMGKNFFGIEEASKHFGVNPSRKQLAILAEVPFCEEVLKACKDTHILVVVFPLSILDVRGIAKELPDQILFYTQDWYDEQDFVKDKGEVGWQLVRKLPVEDSTGKNWKEQQALLANTDEETPKAQVVVYTMVGHFLNTGERLFEKVYVRCVDLDSDGDRVIVGLFGAEGLGFINYSGDGDLGLSGGARKQ